MANVDLSTSENTLEALKEFLLNMKRTIEQICAGHSSAVKQGNLNNTESSHNFGVLSSPPKDFLQPFQGVIPDNGAKPRQIHNWFSSLQDISACVSGKPPTLNDITSSASELDIGNALGAFLQDMKKTIQAWYARYYLLIKGKTADRKALCRPLDSSNMINQLDFGPDTAGHDFSVMEVLDLSNSAALQVSALGRNNKGKRPRLALTNQGRRGKKGHLESRQNKGDTSLFSLQDFNEVMESEVITHGQSSRPQETVILQDQNVGADDELCRHDRQADNSNAIILVEKADGKTGPRKSKLRKKPTTPVNTHELTIRHFQRKVEVVESPDWLPTGWITELKTRTSGGSAGSKDRYFYDPVSKRRCRSQKEVFSLLETGKLGRYKRRTNNKLQPRPTKKLPAGAEACWAAAPTRHEASNINVSERETPAHVPCVSPAPLAISPAAAALGHVGAVNNTMFAPYRPGQPSDWLVYESLASLPRPVLDNLRLTELTNASSKSSGERGPPTPWPWFLNHPESSVRLPFVDRFGTAGNAMLGGRDHMPGIGAHAVAARENDGVAKRPRKPSKRASIT